MKFKDILINNPFTVAIIFFATLVSGVTFIFSKTVAIIELVIILGLSIGALKWLSHIAERKKSFIHAVEQSISGGGDESINTAVFPFPILLMDNKGYIQWFNTGFDKIIDAFGERFSNDVRLFIPEVAAVLDGDDMSLFEMTAGETHYTVYPSRIEENLLSLYFVDDTELKNTRHEFNITRPAVLLINIDSLEQTEEMFDHADYYALVSDIEREINIIFGRENNMIENEERGSRRGR